MKVKFQYVQGNNFKVYSGWREIYVKELKNLVNFYHQEIEKHV